MRWKVIEQDFYEATTRKVFMSWTDHVSFVVLFQFGVSAILLVGFTEMGNLNEEMQELQYGVNE